MEGETQLCQAQRTVQCTGSQEQDSELSLVFVLSLPTVVEGDLDDLIDALQNYDYEARIQNLLEKQTL